MKRQEAIELNGAFAGFKGKFLSDPDYFSYQMLKRNLITYLKEMNEAEGDVVKDFEGVEVIQQGDQQLLKPKPEDAKSFFGKLAEVQKQEFTPDKLNFISNEDFRKCVVDCSDIQESILWQHLAKDAPVTTTKKKKENGVMAKV